jgi:hypothetical protein
MRVLLGLRYFFFAVARSVWNKVYVVPYFVFY